VLSSSLIVLACAEAMAGANAADAAAIEKARRVISGMIFLPRVIFYR
jgi:hypothetical protein